MPCYDPPGTYDGNASELKQRLNQLTDLMCMLLRSLEKQGVDLPVQVSEWWKRHKRWDDKRDEEIK